jgi:signal transduction histidine kinase
MVRRVVSLAVVAIAFTIASGIAIWFARVRAVSDAESQQAKLARLLLDAHAAPDRQMARTLLVPGIRVVVQDFDDGRMIDAGGSGVEELPFGPPEFPPGGAPLPGVGPLPGAGMLDGGPPGAGPGPEHRPGQPPWGVPNIAGRLANIRPVVVERPNAVITLWPDTQDLGCWLGVDALAVLVACVAIGGLATFRGEAFARADRLALETESEQRRWAAERYQRFLADTAHQLRTPLTVVSGYVDILRAGDGRALDQRILEGLHAETARMRLLVSKMLTLARLDSPAGVPRLLDVARAARAAVEQLQRRYPDRDLRLDCEASGTARIVIDVDDFNDALGNLIDNALKYAPRSNVTVTTRDSAGRVEIVVTDRGGGIAPGDREKIFERFYRGANDVPTEGFGLGLAIVKGVADRWNGEIDVDSAPGRTAFTLYFPVADEERHAILAR